MIRRYMLPAFLLLIALIFLFFLDQRIRGLIVLIRADPGLQIMGLIGHIGGWVFLSLIAIIIWIWGNRRKDKRLEISGKYALFAVLGSRLIVEIVKHLAGRPRPAVFDFEGFRIGLSFTKGYDSFPSGHAASSFAFAYILSKFYPERRYLFYTGAIIISFSRIYLDSHFTSDVYAGGVVGLISGMVLYSRLETKKAQ